MSDQSLDERCSKCHRWTFGRRCACRRFECAIPFRDKVDEDDWQEFHATGAEEAAEQYADSSDAGGDYTIARNGEGEIWVRDSDGTVTKWKISAEQVVNYSAREIT